MAEENMLNGSNQSSMIETPEPPPQHPAPKARIDTIKLLWQKIPGKPVIGGFLAGAAVMYGIERLAQLYLDEHAEF